MNKLLLFHLFFLLYPILISSQKPFTKNAGEITFDNAAEGYYITLDGKAVKGYRFLWGNPQSCCHELIIPQQEGYDYRRILPKEIAGYGIANSKIFYTSSIIHTDSTITVFLENLIQVEDNVMFYAYVSPENEERFYVQRGTHQPARLTEAKDIHTYLKSIAPNCPQLKRFEQANVIRRLRFGITAGLYWNRLQIGNGQEYRFPTEITIFPGILIDIPLDRRFRPELIYSYLRTIGKPNQIKERDSKLTFNQKSILLPLMFGYTHTKLTGKILPYIEVGILTNAKLSGKQNYSRSKESLIAENISKTGIPGNNFLYKFIKQ